MSKACEIVGIDRKTHYNYYNSDPEYKEQVDSIADVAIDFVESKLYEKIKGVSIGKETKDGLQVYDVPPSDTAIIFYLKTKGKKRGYVENAIDDQIREIRVIYEGDD